MDDNQKRIELDSRIADLTAARDAATTDAKKAEILTQIQALQQAKNLIDLGQADQLGARIDAILAALDEVQTRHPLDAAAALGRAIGDLRGLRDQL